MQPDGKENGVPAVVLDVRSAKWDKSLVFELREVGSRDDDSERISFVKAIDSFGSDVFIIVPAKVVKNIRLLFPGVSYIGKKVRLECVVETMDSERWGIRRKYNVNIFNCEGW